MNRLAAILPLANVQVGVDATSKKRVFEQAGVLFENQHAIARATVTDNLFARERLGSTGLGHGVAVPHGRVKGLKNPLAAVLRVQTPIPFDAPDDEPVGLLIFLLVPEAATQRHLEILSEIAEMLSDRELRERLKGDVDAATLHRLISDWEPSSQSHDPPMLNPRHFRRCRSIGATGVQGSGRSGSAGLLAAGPSGAASASERGAPFPGSAGLLAAGPSGAASASERGAP